jgi:hypothetical protein
MDATRRKFFTAIAGAFAAAGASTTTNATEWNTVHLALLASQGANVSFDVQGWEIRQIFGVVQMAKQHGAMVTLRSAGMLSPEQAGTLACANVTFEI